MRTRTAHILLGIGTFLFGGLVVCGVVWGVLDYDHWIQSSSSNTSILANSNATVANDNVPATVTNNNDDSANNGNTNTDTSITDSTNPHIPKEYSLDVPYTVQAPHGVWSLPYQEACEEASIMMVGRYLNDRTISDANDADAAILQLVDYVEQNGYSIDMTAAETATVLSDFYEVDTDVIYDFTWDQVKEAVSSGYPVIVPAAGQKLGNSHYQSPGPRYHMLVIIGYTADEIITNDSGTKFGEGYTYDYATLDNAIHDWNGGNVDYGRRVMIVARPE